MQVVSLVEELTHFDINFRELCAKKVIFNEITQDPTCVVNFIFLYYIYKTKYDDGTLNIWVFKHVILEYKNIEKYNAICTDNL